MSARRHFYGACAVTLGAWEATAYATRRLPTVTTTCRRAQGSRYRLVARALVLLWAAGLARHLLGDDA